MNLDIVESSQDESIEERICLVQLTRMGDLIQTYRVSLSFKKYQPESKLCLVARKKMAFPLKELLDQCFDEIFLLDVETMVENATSCDDLVGNITNILEEINSNNFNVLINLSWSRSSEYICSLINANKKMGLVRNENNQIMVNDRWSQFVYSVVMKGSYCPYNVIDIYKSILGMERIITMPQGFENIEYKKIVIHPFASSTKKYWKYNKWVEVIYKVLKTNKEYGVIIVGGAEECEKIGHMLNSPILHKYKDRLESKIGEICVKDLLNMLACSKLFIGHDSFVSHLAALTDIPIVTLAIGTVRVHETAPYTSNAYIISPRTSCFPCFPEEKCDFYKCHADVPYQIVSSIVELVLSGKSVDNSSLNKIMTKFLMSSVDIFKTQFEESGFLKINKITDTDIFLKDIMMMFYRSVFLCFFEMPEEKVIIPELNRKTIKDLQEVMEGLEYVYELYQFGKRYSKNIIEEIGSEVPSVDKIKSYSSRIDEIENLQNLLGGRYPSLKPMVDFFIVARRNMKGKNAVEISEESFYAYHGSSIFVSMMYELCEKTVSRYEKYGFKKNESI